MFMHKSVADRSRDDLTGLQRIGAKICMCLLALIPSAFELRMASLAAMTRELPHARPLPNLVLLLGLQSALNRPAKLTETAIFCTRNAKGQMPNCKAAVVLDDKTL